MTPRPQVDIVADLVAQWLATVGASAAGFEARWTMRALRRVDPELSGRLFRQRGLFDQACITGDREEVELQGAALCRGYAAVIRAMEAAQEPADAYLEGFDASTGLRVAVGHHKASAGLLPANVVWVTPDEVAALMAARENGLLVAVKRQFPGAEVCDHREVAE